MQFPGDLRLNCSVGYVMPRAEFKDITITGAGLGSSFLCHFRSGFRQHGEGSEVVKREIDSERAGTNGEDGD